MRLKNPGFLAVLLFCAATTSSSCSAQSESAAGDTSSEPKEANMRQAERETPRYQVGPWYPATFNIEEPYINIIKASSTRWSSKNFDMDAVLDGGHIGEKTGLPVSLPNGETLTSDVYFTEPRRSGLMVHWDGDWVLDWQTADGECSASVGLLYFPEKNITRRSKCRIEFTRDAAGEVTIYHTAIQVRELKSPLTSLRMYRAENEAALEQGKIYNPAFVDAVRGYDVIRTMDLQEATRASIGSVDQLATMEAAQWGNIAWQSPHNIKHSFLGPPLEAVFAMGVETGASVWAHAPITLGNPVDMFAPEIYDENAGQWLKNIDAAVKPKAEAIVASNEWEAYADAFVAALEKSGYPEDRMLYVTLANEVWNFAGQYLHTTRYANDIGIGLDGGEWRYRYGYGVLMGRFKLALDGALEAAGRDQKLIYVVEGQAANQGTTIQALEAMKAYLESRGETWSDHAGDIGVSVASYWGAVPAHLKRDGVDPNDLEALEDWFINGPANSISTLRWNLKQWRDHARQAEKFGVPLIGAYEGGSHFERPEEMSREAYSAFVWGEPGGRINTAVNEVLAEAFPGVVLSNYVLAGPTGGQPWFEGPLGAENPYNESWERRNRD